MSCLRKNGAMGGLTRKLTIEAKNAMHWTLLQMLYVNSFA